MNPASDPGKKTTPTTTRVTVAVAAIVIAVLAAAAVVLVVGDGRGTSPASGRPQPIRPGAQRLAPPGAPFAYELPEGWVKAVHEGAPNYMTSVGPPLGIGHSGAVVGVALISETDPEDSVRQAYELSQKTLTGPVALPQNVTVADVMLAGHMATRVTFNYDQGGIYEIVKLPNGRVLYMVCQWLSPELRVDAEYGCDSVRRSLTITP